jgi:hypothetical protein
MNSPRLQPGDQKPNPHLPLLAARKAASSGKKREFSLLFPGLKAGAIHECSVVELFEIFDTKMPIQEK